MSLSVPLLPPTALIFFGLQKKKCGRAGQLSPGVNKTRYATPQQPENPANGGLIPAACRLFRLSFRDLTKLQQRVAKGRLKKEEKIHQAIGRLMERYPRVVRYYKIAYDSEQQKLSWKELADKKTLAQKLDGSYVLKTDRQDLTADEIWRTYILLTRVEDAFRDMKSPLMERPIFHHLKNRTQTHIFLCVLAYHLLAAIEHRFLQAGVHTSWWTIRQQLSTHQVATIVLPTPDGRVLKIRKATTPEPEPAKSTPRFASWRRS